MSPIPRNTDFAKGVAFPALFLNRLQELMSTFMMNTELSYSGQIVTLTCGAGENASVLAIAGKLRYSEASKTIDMTAQGNGTYGLWAVTTATDTDPSYTFVANTGTPAGSHVRKIGEVIKAAGVLGSLKQLVGYEKHSFMHAVGGGDPLPAGSITAAKLSGPVTGAIAPPGLIVDYAASTPPAGWLSCDGSVLVRTDYAALFAAIGTSYNTGGETASQFRLPDYRGRIEVGKGTHADVDTLGESDGNSVGSRTPVHTHSFAAHGHGKGSLAISGGFHGHTQQVAGDHSHAYAGVAQYVGSSGETYIPGGTDWVIGGAPTQYAAGGHAHTMNANTHTHPASEITGIVGPNTNGDATLTTAAQAAAEKLPFITTARIIKT